jgi:two-component system, cell cycle response regulator
VKVLIVDDDPDALEIVKLRLAKEPLEILCAEGGVLGLEMARRENPDLILLDVDMPGMSGFEVCRELKADRNLCMIPVLFLTCSNEVRDKIQGLDFGAIDYIAKPFDAFELRARVRAAIRTKHIQDVLIEHAQIDALTGLPNRRMLTDRLQTEWARIERHEGRLSFIMADVDHFKSLNDRYGHEIGDRILRQIAGVFAQQCRKSDLPSRCGGEEFAIVVPDEKASNAALLADRIRLKIAETVINVNDETVTATASFGVADSTSADSPESLMKLADQALYQAKNEGRNRVETHESDRSPLAPGEVNGETSGSAK